MAIELNMGSLSNQNRGNGNGGTRRQDSEFWGNAGLRFPHPTIAGETVFVSIGGFPMDDLVKNFVPLTPEQVAGTAEIPTSATNPFMAFLEAAEKKLLNQILPRMTTFTPGEEDSVIGLEFQIRRTKAKVSAPANADGMNEVLTQIRIGSAG